MFIQFDDGCGRYTLSVQAKALKDRYKLVRAPYDVTPNYDVSPGQLQPVIALADSGATQTEMMKWGLIPTSSKDPNMGYKLFNARDDSLY